MNLKSDMSRIRIIATVVLVILFATWWANGRDDTWLYVMSAFFVATLFFPSIVGKNNKDQ
jgi:hypothetical protein